MNRSTRSTLRSLPLTRTRHLRPAHPPVRRLSVLPPAPTRHRTALQESAVAWGYYLGGHRQPGTDLAACVAAARAGDGFVWLGVHEPTAAQLTQLGAVFGLHPLSVEDASNPCQRPKFERDEDYTVLALRTLAYLSHDQRAGQPEESDEGGEVVETGTIMVFVGDWFVVTVRHGRHASMSGLRQRLERDPRQVALGPSAVLHAVVDKVVDDYLVVTDAVLEDIEEIENSVFAARNSPDIERIYQLKRDVIEMKRTVGPLGLPVRQLSERPQPFINPEIREYFRDVDDHLARVREQVASFDELLTSILQAGLARLSVAENEDMRRISAWVAIAAVPTMIAGIYGMNFEYMPELQTRWGYPSILMVMVTACGMMFRGFKRNGWL
jgi:magnesium transporter